MTAGDRDFVFSSSLKVEFVANQELSALSIASGRTVDLNDKKMVIDNGNYTTIAAAIASARNFGAWNGTGLHSTAAAEESNDITTLGVMTRSEYGSSTFGGITLESGDILVRYTYNGDADFTGAINFDDYAKIDWGFDHDLTGWFNGDFDLNGVVNFDDYSLIDNAFTKQGSMLFSGPGGGNPLLIALGQMEHFTQSYMNHFIDWNDQHYGVIYTEADFFPDGAPW